MDLDKYIQKSLVSIFEKENNRQTTVSECKKIESFVNEIITSYKNVHYSGVGIERDVYAVRKRNVRNLLHLISLAEDIALSKSFYELDKHIGDFLYVKSKLSEQQIYLTNEEFDTTIRLCRILHSKGICQRELSQTEIHNIQNWESYSFNNPFLINNIAASFKTYWDDVLAGYKRPSVRLNRINYLIDHLNEMKNKETIQLFTNYEEIFNELIQHYSSFL